MRPRTLLRFLLQGAACVLLYLPITYAQLPSRLERCLPFPTYAQEVMELNEEVAAKTAFAEPRPRIIIDVVKFEGPIHIPQTTVQQLITELKQHTFDTSKDWLQELQEVGIESVWRDNGYFKSVVTAKAAFISSDSRGMHVSVTAHVDEGLQYRLGTVQFRSSDPNVPLAFGAEELRKQIPMNDGDVFSAAKIRASLDALKNLYGSNGYIDFVAEPLTDIDDSRQHISLIIKLDQQKQFRLAKVEALGLDPKMEFLFKSKLKTGDVFNSHAVEDFLKQNAAALPPDILPSDIELHRDVRRGTVDLQFNVYQGCPNLPN
jgi:outer membrane protein assembly factor BamA